MLRLNCKEWTWVQSGESILILKSAKSIEEVFVFQGKGTPAVWKLLEEGVAEDELRKVMGKRLNNISIIEELKEEKIIVTIKAARKRPRKGLRPKVEGKLQLNKISTRDLIPEDIKTLTETSLPACVAGLVVGCQYDNKMHSMLIDNKQADG